MSQLKKNFLIENYFMLEENFIISKAEAKQMTGDNNLFQLDEVENIKVLVKKAEGEKCPRCWKISPKPCERCGEKK